ncbi:MAG: hypothetical protein F6K14_20335 [Symploca sp. SIO2C1]|nr:hypothetical protein [Symploca sp. SIO2C1]
MFDELLKSMNTEVSTVSAIIKTNNKLRNILFSRDSLSRQKLEENSEFLELSKLVPSERQEWQIYDHCATVTRLYAIYERFVEHLILDWLLLLPELISNYSDLGDKIQNTHREGVGRLLLDLNKNRFQHLSIEKVVQGLFSGVTGTEQYELLPDAFLSHEQNLRKEILEKLLADAGIENAWKWIDKHRNIKYFVEKISARQHTAEGQLKRLVDYRNEAAHRGIFETMSTQELLDLGDFVKALCEALAELVSYQIILRKISIAKAKEIGQITEWFKKPRAAVATVTDITLAVGGNIWLVSETSSYCKLANIESIQIDDIDKNEVKITSKTEVGLKLDTDAKQGLSLYVME